MVDSEQMLRSRRKDVNAVFLERERERERESRRWLSVVLVREGERHEGGMPRFRGYVVLSPLFYGSVEICYL